MSCPGLASQTVVFVASTDTAVYAEHHQQSSVIQVPLPIAPVQLPDAIDGLAVQRSLGNFEARPCFKFSALLQGLLQGVVPLCQKSR